MYLDKMTGALEAVLFAAGEPVSVAELADLLQLDKPQVWELVSELKQSYEAESTRHTSPSTSSFTVSGLDSRRNSTGSTAPWFFFPSFRIRTFMVYNHVSPFR